MEHSTHSGSRLAPPLEAAACEPACAKTRARWLVPALKIALAAGLIYYVLAKGDIKIELLKRLYREPQFFIAAMLCLTAQLCVGAQRLRMLLAAQGVRIGLRQMIRLTYLGAFFDAFLVTSVGGDAVKAVYLARDLAPERRTGAVSTLVLDRLLGLLGLLTLTLLMSLWELKVLWGDSSIRPYFIALMGGSLGLLAGTGMLFSRRVFNARPMKWFMGILPFSATVVNAYRSLQQYRDQTRVVIAGWLMSLGVHVLGVCAGYQLALGLGLGTSSFSAFFVAWFIANFVCSFAAFNGIGWGQLMYKEIFMGVAGVADGASLATAVQILSVLAKMPGLAAWLAARERGAGAARPGAQLAAETEEGCV